MKIGKRKKKNPPPADKSRCKTKRNAETKRKTKAKPLIGKRQ